MLQDIKQKYNTLTIAAGWHSLHLLLLLDLAQLVLVVLFLCLSVHLLLYQMTVLPHLSGLLLLYHCLTLEDVVQGPINYFNSVGKEKENKP